MIRFPLMMDICNIFVIIADNTGSIGLYSGLFTNIRFFSENIRIKELILQEI
jgi:hypothetical protein